MNNKLKLFFIFFCFVFFNLIACNEHDYRDIYLKTLESIELPSFVTDNINLVTNMTIDDCLVNIEYISSDENVISKTGVITRGNVDQEVHFKVIITINDKKYENILDTIIVKRLEKKFTINYDLDGGILDKLLTTIDENVEYTLNNPIKDGYEFLGWFKVVNGVVSEERVIKVLNQDVSVKAKWSETVIDKLLIETDLPNPEVGEEALLLIDGKMDLLENYDVEITPSEAVDIDEELYCLFLKSGLVTIKFTRKDDSKVCGSITINVLNQLPDVKPLDKPVIINSTFSLKIRNYDETLVKYTYDETFFTLINNEFKALKLGSSTIKITHVNDEKCYKDVSIIVYDKEPVVQLDSYELTLNMTTRMDIMNYDSPNDYVITCSDSSIIEIKGRLITGKKVGNVDIKVALINDDTCYTIIHLKVKPINPELRLTSENIRINGNSRLIIYNLDNLENKDLGDYSLEIQDNDIVLVDENYLVHGLKVGKTKIRISLVDDPTVFGEVIVNVCSDEVKYGLDGEVSEKLVLYIDDFDGYIKAGEMDYIKILGAIDYSKYRFTTSNDSVITVFEDGRFIAIKEGMAFITVMNKADYSINGVILIVVKGVTEVNYIERIIQIATKEIGYREKGDNGTKYGDWYNLPGEPWCAMFVSWCANQAGISTDIIPKYCGCTAGKNWFVERNQFGYKKDGYIPKAGDIIFFLDNGSSHTGLVINCVGNTVYTIEGNTSDMVAKRQYNLNYASITGYGIPNYPYYSGNVEGGSTGGATSGEGEKTN